VSEFNAARLHPTADYRALLRGEITPEEYIQRMKADVNKRMRDWPGTRRRQHGACVVDESAGMNEETT